MAKSTGSTQGLAGRTDLDRQQLVAFYREMVLIRRFEEKCQEMYTRGKIGGFLHLYIGEEAVAVGAIHAMRPDDDLITHYRDHGYALVKGCDPERVMAELFGKATGVSGGMGGSMHLADVQRHFWGGHAIVGGHMPIATGLAFAAQYRGLDRVTVAIFGDGSTDIGTFHEAMSFAAAWKLPVVFLCENNLYGMGVAIEKATAVPEIHQKAAGYGIASSAVDGMDVLAVYEAMGKALDHVRSGKGPYFLEAMCYRFRGHSAADPEMYRKKDEVERWKQRDPLLTFGRHLEEQRLLSAEERAKVDAEVDHVLEASVRFADESPDPSMDALTTGIYAKPVGEEARGGRF